MYEISILWLYYIMLYYIVLYCTILYYIAYCILYIYNVLYYIVYIIYCIVLYHIVITLILFNVFYMYIQIIDINIMNICPTIQCISWRITSIHELDDTMSVSVQINSINQMNTYRLIHVTCTAEITSKIRV